MDRAMPTRAIRLFWRQAGVLLPSLVNEVHTAVRATRPRERRDSVDDRPEFAERVPNLTKHSFAGFPSAHRPTNLDSRTPQEPSDNVAAAAKQFTITVCRSPGFGLTA